MTTKVEIVNPRKFTPAELIKLNNAGKHLSYVINSAKFKQEVYKADFVDTDGLTNAEIYDVIMSGKESYKPDVDYTLTFYLEIIHKRFSSAIAFTYPDIATIYLNRKFYKNMTAQQVAGTLAHEMCHKLGFNHAYYNTANRSKSVPYAIGYIVQNIVANESLSEFFSSFPPRA